MTNNQIDVLLIGSGGRENALAKALFASPRLGKLYGAPGNPGISQYGELIDLSVSDTSGLVKFAKEKSIGLVVVGPEAPLVAGLADELTAEGILVFGPSASGARIEGSKVFAKEIMQKAAITQAEPYGVFSDVKEAVKFIEESDFPVVIKADGLCGGKGVAVPKNKGQALQACEDMLVLRRFGEAGSRIVIERQLSGDEVSLLFVCDGKRAIPLASARDYKRLETGNIGPNTGGMGAHSPGDKITPELVTKVHDEVVIPLLKEMAKLGAHYRGILYCGLMLTREGPKVLEFNCRFGDPETQVILPRLKSCLITLLESAAKGDLSQVKLQWDERAALCVVLASPGYPMAPKYGQTIKGLEDLDEDIFVFHAGTKEEGNELITSGGRVIAIGGLGNSIKEARERTYSAIDAVQFDGMHFRRDIGAPVRGE